MKRTISLLLATILLAGFVFAITEQEKESLISSLEQYKDNPEMLRIVMAFMNSAMDVSNEPEIVAKAEQVAKANSIDIDKDFPYIKKGIPEELLPKPVEVQQTQPQETTEQPQLTPLETQTGEGTQTEGTPEAGKPADMTTLLIVAGAIIIAAVVFWLIKRKK